MISKKPDNALIWNYVSLLIMAFSGFIMNTVITVFYGAEALGVFNETYAWYMILSQISVWGIHMAIVKYVPENEDNFSKGTILKTGLLLGTIISITTTLISEVVVFFLNEVEWQRSMQVAFGGLILFAVNKILLNYLNAEHRMVAYAFFTSLRYGFFGAIIIIISITQIDYNYLSIVFPLTEVTVFIAMIAFYRAKLLIEGIIDLETVKRIIRFGTSILPSYMVLELNTKVDVVCLGLLISETRTIGVYSFAILFTEGFYMMYIVFRRIINPSLSEANARGDICEYVRKKNFEMRRYLYCGGCAMVLALSICFYFLCMILAKPDHTIGIIYLLVISISIMINGKSIVYGDLLAQTGFPVEESILNILTVVVNFIMNILLIPIFGALGAALATAISYYVYSIYMRYRIKQRLGVRI